MKTPRLILPSDAALAGRDSRDLARLRNNGRLVRVRRGVYAESSDWKALDAASQYGLRAAAFQARAKRPPVFCHATAAMLWGLWLVDTPTKLHVVTESRAGGRSRNDVIRHLGTLDSAVVRCGQFLVTDKLATTIALIARLPFEQAVAVCDSSLHEVRRRDAANIFTPALSAGDRHDPLWKNDDPQGPPLRKSDLLVAADLLPSAAAGNRARAVIEFSSGLSGSAGESLSRVRMKQLGFIVPELQHRFVLRDGSNAFVDFWFGQQRRAGEFDGRTKYLRAGWGGGKSVQDRIIDEKNREDQIRAQDVGFVRWTWAEMMNLAHFEQLLRQAGIPQEGPHT